jgi:hypothetical protein
MSKSTPTSVDELIRTRLLSLENSFFQALHGGPDALAAFNYEISDFYEAVSRSEQHLEEETRLMIYSFVQISNVVIPNLIDLDIASGKIALELNKDINKVFAELSLEDSTTPGSFPFPLTWYHAQKKFDCCRTRNISNLHSTRPCLAFE